MLQLAVVVGSILAVFIAITPQGRAGFETALFVLDILEAPYSPRALAGPEVVRQQVSYETARGMSIAQVYRIADDEPRPAVVLSIGVSEEGFDHPNAVILGNALARAGIVVMYHWPMEMALHNNLDPQEIDNLVSAFIYLEEQENVDSERVGLGGFCVGGSFALVAASDHRIRDRVELVNVFGPYFDGREIVFQAVANAAVYRQQRIPWEPDPATTMVLRKRIAGSRGGNSGRRSARWKRIDGWDRETAGFLDAIADRSGCERPVDWGELRGGRVSLQHPAAEIPEGTGL